MHPSNPSFSILQIAHNFCSHVDTCNIPKYHEPSDASTLMSKQTSIFGTPPLHNQLETGVFVANTNKKWHVAPICTNKNELSWLQHVGKNLVISNLSFKLSNLSQLPPWLTRKQKKNGRLKMGAPLGAAGMLSKRNIPSFLLSLAKGRSPCKTITWAHGWNYKFPCFFLLWVLTMFETSYGIKKCGIIHNLLKLSSEPSQRSKHPHLRLFLRHLPVFANIDTNHQTWRNTSIAIIQTWEKQRSTKTINPFPFITFIFENKYPYLSISVNFPLHFSGVPLFPAQKHPKMLATSIASWASAEVVKTRFAWMKS